MIADTTLSFAPNFLCRIIDEDLRKNRFDGKCWIGKPGPARMQVLGKPDVARIRTRFPPEPNGHLHIGHAKSICINFGLAKKYGGVCHLRFDDTNPETEKKEYVDAIIEAVRWLGFDWCINGNENLYFASDYFDYMYEFAEALVEAGHAYVDEQNPDEIRINRGTLTKPGSNSPWRDRPVSESLNLLRDMCIGKYPDGSLVLRAKLDMSSPNINLRDPIMYRIRHIIHHRTGKQRFIYPMYSWAHPIEDALEGITHSICTLEFEDQRPFYNWILNRLTELGKLIEPLPKQYEFARLNLSYVITSKRKLSRLIDEGHVNGWDDPRMPTLLGLRRRGYTPAALRSFCENTAISKSDSYINYSLLEQAIRKDLDPIATRSMAILDPIKLIITNYPKNRQETCYAPCNPHKESDGQRKFPFSREIWIDRDDFREKAPRKYFRLFPGNTVRLKYSYIITCTGYNKNKFGEIIEIYAEYLPGTKSGTPGSNRLKVKGNITWISIPHAISAKIHLYDRLFSEAYPDSNNRNFLLYLNPNSKKTVQAVLEPGTLSRNQVNIWQFERLGYFTLDLKDSCINDPVINRIVTLKDSWSDN